MQRRKSLIREMRSWLQMLINDKTGLPHPGVMLQPVFAPGEIRHTAFCKKEEDYEWRKRREGSDTAC